MADLTFVDLWVAARERVLTRYAGQATANAEWCHARKAAFPGHADELEACAVAGDVYAAECRSAAADPTLPTPSGPNYPQETDHA